MSINFIGYASGVAAGNPGCADGPRYFQEKFVAPFPMHWEIVAPDPSLRDKYARVAELNTRLAKATEASVNQQTPFVVMGGDHSSGIGTWSGVAKAIHAKGELGLIWIDAHLDAHTPETTPSGNIHGMPVATLLGYGPTVLTHIALPQPKLHPKNLFMIGIRSFEAEEKTLLERLGVRIYDIEEVKRRGLETIFHEALAYLRKHTVGYGMSIDLDGIDPIFTPGTGTPEARGLNLEETCNALHEIKKDKQFLGLEIAEFNPHECQDDRTFRSICQMINAVYL